MFIFLVIPMILFFTLESLLWKRNRKSLTVSLVGVAMWSFIFVGTTFLIFLTFTDGMLENIGWVYMGLTTIQVGLIIGTILLWVQIMRTTPLSVAEPISLLRVIILTVLAFLIFQNATISTTDIIFGSILLVACMLLGHFQGRDKSHIARDKNFSRGMLYMLGWIACSVTLNLINQEIMMNHRVHPITHATMQNAIMVVGVFAFVLAFKTKQFGTIFKSAIRDKNYIGIGLGGVAGRVCFFFALANFGMNVGVLTALQVASVALVVALSAWLYRERVRWFSYVLIAVIIASAVVMSIM